MAKDFNRYCGKIWERQCEACPWTYFMDRYEQCGKRVKAKYVRFGLKANLKVDICGSPKCMAVTQDWEESKMERIVYVKKA